MWGLGLYHLQPMSIHDEKFETSLARKLATKSSPRCLQDYSTTPHLRDQAAHTATVARTPYKAVQQQEGTDDAEHPALGTQDEERPESQNEARKTLKAAHDIRSGIHWMVPSAMIGFFLLATAVVIIHYVYYQHLDQRFVASTVPQAWNNAFSITFSRIFSTIPATSASKVLIQILWWSLWHRAMFLSDIDALLSFNCSPLNLCRPGLLSAAPIFWIFGLLTLLISIATIFPPGSIVIKQLPHYRSEAALAPNLDIDCRGHDSTIESWE
jgi:hypothetical protein